MKRIFYLSLLFISITFSSSFAQSIVKNNIHFHSNAYSLDANNQMSLQTFLEDLASFNEYSIQIIGHTDQDGSNEYNMELSKKRAEAVRQFFLENGSLATNIEVNYRGESDLVLQAVDSESKQQNRRVEVIASGYNYDNVIEMVTQLEADAIDLRRIDPNIESNLSLKKGTDVKIPEHAFCHLDGSPLENGTVELTFKEVFEYAEMMDECLFTQTKDQWLETGGMIYIEATQNGKPLKLQDGKSIEFLLPVQDEKEGMELFTGSEDDNGIIWEETGEEITSKKEKSGYPAIKVDLTPLLDFVFTEQEDIDLNYPEMLPYPHPARIAYLPYKANYTEEEYEEALRKYNVVMEAHEKDKLDRPQRLEQWQNELTLRKLDFYKHKENAIASKLRKKLKVNLVRLNQKKDEICHEKLVNVLFRFLEDEVGKIDYDEWYYLQKFFGKSLGDAKKYGGLNIPRFEKMNGAHFCVDFIAPLNEIVGRIEDKKFEMGIVDDKTVSRYLMKSSKLGWINCDRFYRISENDKTDFEFASGSGDEQYYLIFKNIRSMIRPIRKEGKVVFKGIPLGESVRLVAINVQNGKANLALQDLKIDKNLKVNLAYAPAEIEDLRQALTVI